MVQSAYDCNILNHNKCKCICFVKKLILAINIYCNVHKQKHRNIKFESLL